MTIYDFLKELPNCFNNPQKEDFEKWIEKHTTKEENKNKNFSKPLDKPKNLWYN